MPRILTYIKLGISREEVDEYPDWQQGLPQRTAAETASYFLGFLKKILLRGPGFFSEDAYLAQFESLLDTAINHFDSGNIQEGITQIEDQILPAINQMVLAENRIGFRDLVNTAEYFVLFPGENYYTPPLDEIVEQDIKECTTITATGHISRPFWAKCSTGTVTGHIDKVENEEE
jgi:hypothetical protein